MNSANKVRSFLAAMGADLSSIDNSFRGDERYGDASGNRMTVSKSIEEADIKMRQRFGLDSPVSTQTMDYPVYNIPQVQMPVQMVSQPIQQNQSREERINRLLGKITPTPVQHQPVVNEEHMRIVAAVKEAIEPVTEHLEDISVLLGLLVQRMEKLIYIVDPTADADINSEVREVPEANAFQTDMDIAEEQMEVFDPEVSMSVIDDEKETDINQTKKKRKRAV